MWFPPSPASSLDTLPQTLSKGDPCQATEGAFVRNGVPTVAPGRCSQHKPAHRWCHWALRRLGRNKRCCVTVLQLAFVLQGQTLPSSCPKTTTEKITLLRLLPCAREIKSASRAPGCSATWIPVLLESSLPGGQAGVNLQCWQQTEGP